MYFYKGELPWQTLYMKNIDDTKEKYQRIMESKIKHVPDLLCKDSPGIKYLSIQILILYYLILLLIL